MLSIGTSEEKPIICIELLIRPNEMLICVTAMLVKDLSLVLIPSSRSENSSRGSDIVAIMLLAGMLSSKEGTDNTSTMLSIPFPSAVW